LVLKVPFVDGEIVFQKGAFLAIDNNHHAIERLLWFWVRSC
jgi:hypothetical protein